MFQPSPVPSGRWPAPNALQLEWEKILAAEGLGLYRGMCLGPFRIVYIATYREADRPFSYRLATKERVRNPYYSYHPQPRVSLEHTRERKRRNKRAQLERQRQRASISRASAAGGNLLSE